MTSKLLGSLSFTDAPPQPVNTVCNAVSQIARVDAAFADGNGVWFGSATKNAVKFFYLSATKVTSRQRRLDIDVTPAGTSAAGRASLL